MPLGWPELLVILVIVLLVFGPKRLPMLGRQLGGGMREFKDSISGKSKRDDEVDDAQDAEIAPELPRGERDESATRPGR